MTRQTIETEELASVVVAEEARESARPWYIILRPWLFCLMFLLLAECGARIVYDHTLILQHERFDNFPSAASEDTFVREMAADHAYKVVMIGDSVLVGASLLEKEHTIARCLERELQRAVPGRPIHVWNFSIAGARSPDEYALLLKALPAHPDLVIVQANYMNFAMDITKLPMSNSWLARNLPEMPPALAPLAERLSAREAFEERLTNAFERNIRLIGMRQATNAMLFGIQPKIPWSSPNPFIMTMTRVAKKAGKVKMESWKERGLNPLSFIGMYRGEIKPDNLNGRIYRDILAELHRRHIPAFTYLTPQNPTFMDLYLDRGSFSARRKAVAAFLADPEYRYQDYTDLVPSELFYDNDHMLAKGNHRVAQQIAGEVAPLIRQRLARAR